MPSSDLLARRLPREALAPFGAVDLAGIPVGEWRIGGGDAPAFGADLWVIDGTHYPTQRTANFATALPLGMGRLVDPGRETLLFDAKLAIWHAERLSAPDPRGTRVLYRWSCLRPLVAWMLREGIPDFGFLTRTRLWNREEPEDPGIYAAALLEHMGDDPDQIADGTVRSYLRQLSTVYEARALLEAFGRPAMIDPPFDAGEFVLLAARMGQKPGDETRPIPDEVAIPLMNAAHAWLGARADDVVRIAETWERSTADPLGPPGARVGAQLGRLRAAKAIAELSFSTLDDTRPWHAPLFKRGGRSARGHVAAVLPRTGGLTRFAELWRTVQAAALIVLQQSSGMRSEELLTLRAGRRADGTPRCLEARVVAGGTRTMYLLRASIGKVNEGIPDGHEFVVGLQPNLAGADPLDVPAVRAVDVLLRLSEPLRRLPDMPDAMRDLLVIRFGSASLSHTGHRITRMQHIGLPLAYRDFVRRTCGDALAALPDDSPALVQDGWLGEWRDTRGDVLCPRMWRKTFANFAYSTMPDLVEEIRIQYGHVSRAMTMRYANNDYQLRQMNEMEAEMATERIVEALSVGALAGRGAAQLSEKREWSELREAFDASPAVERRDVVRRFLLRSGRLTDTRARIDRSAGADGRQRILATAVSDAPHGCCAAISISSADMECRKAGGTANPLFDGFGPDRRFRTPTRCGGCVNYLVWGRHGGYWKDRYAAAREEEWFYRLRGEPPSLYAAVRRTAEQAQSYLALIGVPDEVVETLAREAEVRARAAAAPPADGASYG